MGFSDGNTGFSMPVVPDTSRDSGPYQSYDHGYSGHSVNDVMIMALERSITPDMSEMEKQRIYDQIKMIRERKD